MQNNQSMPTATLIPVLAYDNAADAAQWLVQAFGFTIRLRIGDHRIQLTCGTGALIARQRESSAHAGDSHDLSSHSVMMRVGNVREHYARALAFGVTTGGAPIDFPFGERQYNAVDIGGHSWTFSESIADIDPASWGGELIE